MELSFSFVLRPTTTTGTGCPLFLPFASTQGPGSLRLQPRHLVVSASAGGEGKGKEKRLFALGTGFVARYVSKRLMEEEGDAWDIYGTCTSTLKKGVLEEMGVKAYTFNASEHRLEKLDSLPHATHLLVSIPPLPSLGDPLLCMLEDLRGVLSSGNLQWLCYLSSTSVYGDCQGDLVNEDYPANPAASDAAKARMTAEKGWLDLGIDLQVPSYVFRLGGSYGPGRSALDTIIKGKVTQSQRLRHSKLFTARIHVADVYQAIKASFYSSASGYVACILEQTSTFYLLLYMRALFFFQQMVQSDSSHGDGAIRIFNIVDDDPAPRSEVFAFAKGLLEEKFPSQIGVELPNDAEIMANQEATHRGEKRVSNARMKKDLGVNLTYPSYREGLQHVLTLL